MVNPVGSSKVEQNNIKSIIGSSYNRLYSQFTSDELTEVGNYKILKQIGEGSFGKVYLALHRPTHRKVCLKTSDKNDPNIVREVFYHRQFDFPYITKLYEVIVTESKVWMALEYCPGKELYDHLLSLHRISLLECGELFAQISGAVYYAHSMHCVHRDLKLENILLDKNGNAKLTDFGFTRECMTKTTLETVCGTTVYMAPELIGRKTYDGFKIDTWSLGVILYTLITGSLPFDDDDEAKTKWKIVNEEPKYDPKLIPDDAKDLISRLLAKNPGERPSLPQVLRHPFLQPYGSVVLDQTEKILCRQRSGGIQFKSKLERRLLKRLKQSGIDTQAVKQSILKRKCDSLSGLWLLLLAQEKKQENCKCPKRSRSVLSVKKVIENATHNDINKTSDDILKPALELSRATSLSKMLNKGSDMVTSMTPISAKKSKDSAKVLHPTFSKIPSQRAYSHSIVNSPRKSNNFLQKVSSFFKSKKNPNNSSNSNSSIYTGVGEDSVASSKGVPASGPFLVKKTSSFQKSRTDVGADSSKTNSKESLKKKVACTIALSSGANVALKYSKTSGNSMEGVKETPELFSNEHVRIEEPRLKRFKSSISSEISRTSTGNYDSESVENSRSISFDGKVSPPPIRTRPLSEISQISNDTYISEYSTDGNNSSFKISDTAKPSYIRKGSETTSQYSASSEKMTNGYGRKFVRRDLSIISTASSASERSSRTDSFYDITTATPAITTGNGSNRNSNFKESVLPRFGTQRPWTGKRTYTTSRHGKNARRSSKRGIFKISSSNTDSIIQEVSSSEEEDHNILYNKRAGLPKPVLQTKGLTENGLDEHDEEGDDEAGDDEYAVHTDGEFSIKPQFSDDVIDKQRGLANVKAVATKRSLSEGSNWSSSYLDSDGNRQRVSSMLEDDRDSTAYAPDKNMSGKELKRLL
ncbi:non-specific serine/threonine protein kinase SKDI_16G1260 [Saccharomyces kudriavzevii IFO 1802]|uniref:non-specific serine/threonine protein kinase n=1 Tax=Saccharomyces kudriavzevii (strain ATCC MYA-4449 / AS 2.2408 / CBS 8840 / NBRC 1802 / NCYC 2889) TaxID=226230 RepID=A0AA35NN34_SACK1|nr:uncharacterized protein SKDI_16G1260 [Saccharomyces kudriavzevii IFO 1802]CAI4053083.1 hypothetical protein SKDI_16G1260 [Saccharomyces kudriavzevii IFO 1802]